MGQPPTIPLPMLAIPPCISACLRLNTLGRLNTLEHLRPARSLSRCGFFDDEWPVVALRHIPFGVETGFGKKCPAAGLNGHNCGKPGSVVRAEIGRVSCRERVGQYVSISAADR